MVRLFEHFWIKIIALVLGLLLWFHVATEKVYNYQVLLPVTEIALKEDLTLAKNPPDSLMVLVSATGKQLLRQKWRGRGLRITAAQLGSGRHKLDLTTSNTFLTYEESGVSLDELISPTSVTLHVDGLSEARVTVEPDIIAKPDNGFAVSGISRPDPPEVTLIGPRSTVKSYRVIYTERKELSGLRNSVTLTLPLAKPVGYGVALEPDSVRLSIEVVAVRTREFRGIPIVIYNAPPDSAVTSNPATITIELTGSPAEIDLLNRNAITASADYRRIDSAGRVLIKIDCPSMFKVKRTSADTAVLRAN